jgi:hypothetical protein
MSDRVGIELATLSGAKPYSATILTSVTRVGGRVKQSSEYTNLNNNLTLSVTLSLPLRGRRCDRVAVTVRRGA